MDKALKIFSISLIVFLFSCAAKNGKTYLDKPSDKVKKENVSKIKGQKIQQELRKKSNITYLPPPPLMITSTIKKIDPLEKEKITLTATNAQLKNVLYLIANDLGMNLVISPEVDTSKTITLNFNNTSAKTVLSIIEDIAGIFFEVKDNVIYVKETKTKIFKIPYVKTTSDYNARLGGDVLGATGTGGVTGGAAPLGTAGIPVGGTGGLASGTGNLSGNFQLNFDSPPDVNNFYQQLEDNIKNLLSDKGNYTLNKFTGTLIVTDKKDNLRKIEKLIKSLKHEINKQVLIEAKIVEVNLSDNFQYGIDWSALLAKIGNTSIAASQSLALAGSYGQIIAANTNFNAVINALADVGKIETLSNPRIRVLNGQSALISTGTVTPFWEKQIQTVTTTTTTQAISYIRSSVLDGILLGVSPHINDDGTITLNIVPVSTNVRGTRQLVVGNEVQAEAPILEIKEAGTTIKVKDNTLIIIGGLITKNKLESEKKIPFLGDIPIAGNLFKSKQIQTQKKELIIFLKPKIIKNIE